MQTKRPGTQQSAHQSSQQPTQASVLRAYLNWREGRYPEALQDIDAAEPTLREAGHWVWLARALNIKGSVLMFVGQAPQAADAEMAALAHNDIGVQLV